MTRKLLLALVLLSSFCAVKAQAQAPIINGVPGCGMAVPTSGGFGGNGVANGCAPGVPSTPSLGPQPKGDIQLVNATNFILQTDGASLICRAGGC